MWRCAWPSVASAPLTSSLGQYGAALTRRSHETLTSNEITTVVLIRDDSGTVERHHSARPSEGAGGHESPRKLDHQTCAVSERSTLRLTSSSLTEPLTTATPSGHDRPDSPSRPHGLIHSRQEVQPLLQRPTPSRSPSAGLRPRLLTRRARAGSAGSRSRSAPPGPAAPCPRQGLKEVQTCESPSATRAESRHHRRPTGEGVRDYRLTPKRGRSGERPKFGRKRPRWAATPIRNARFSSVLGCASRLGWTALC